MAVSLLIGLPASSVARNVKLVQAFAREKAGILLVRPYVRLEHELNRTPPINSASRHICSGAAISGGLSRHRFRAFVEYGACAPPRQDVGSALSEPHHRLPQVGPAAHAALGRHRRVDVCLAPRPGASRPSCAPSTPGPSAGVPGSAIRGPGRVL